MKTTPLENWIINQTSIGAGGKRALEEYQWGQLKSTLGYARKMSRFYNKLFRGLNVDSLKSMKDFQNIPFTFPEDLKRVPHDFLCVPEKDVKRIVTLKTSGTSGEEKRIFFTEKDLEYTIDFFRYGMSCLVSEMDRVLVLLPGKAYGSIGDLLEKALFRSGIECVVNGVLTDVEAVGRIVEQRKITCIVGIPWQILYLSRIRPELFEKHIKKVLLSTDYVPRVVVEELKKAYECAVYNHYGMTEMGYGGGVECEALKGYHLREGDLYFEIVNPETGEAVPAGEYGEVVFTTFHRQAMPLIRYRTGDISRFIPTPCECATFLRTMDKVMGRMNNKIIFRNSEAIHQRDLDEIIFEEREVLDYTAGALPEERLKIILTLRGINNYDTIKTNIVAVILEKYGIMSEIEYRLALEMPKVMNSMLKRQLYDFRKEEAK